MEEKVRSNDAKVDRNEESQDKVRVSDQCLLMLVAKELADRNKNKKYENLAVIDSNDPSTVISTLFTKGTNADELFNIDSSDLSKLVPEVRLFKSYPDPNNEFKERLLAEISFDDTTSRESIDNITKNAAGRGRDVGMKSFSWSNDGGSKHLGNYFVFGAKLVIFMQNLEELFVTREVVSVPGTKERIEVKLADLISPPERENGKRIYKDEYYRLKAVVGWHVPRNSDLFANKKIKKALEKTRRVLYLTLKGHELDVRDDGSVELTIEYVAASEMMANTPEKSNVLIVGDGVEREKRRIRKRIEGNIRAAAPDLAALGANNKEKDEIGFFDDLFGIDSQRGAAGDLLEQLEEKNRPLREQLESYESNKKDLVLSRIIRKLYGKDFEECRIFLFKISKDKIQKTKEVLSSQRPSLTALTEVQRIAATGVKNTEKSTDLPEIAGKEIITDESLDPDERAERFSEDRKKIQDYKNNEEENDTYVIPYFHLGDLFDVTLDQMFETTTNKTFLKKDLRVVLGPISFYDNGGYEDNGVSKRNNINYVKSKDGKEKVIRGKPRNMSISDIPISLKTFTHWFTEKVIKNGRTEYSLRDFTNDVIKDLVIKAVALDCPFYAPSQEGVQLAYKTFSTSQDDTTDLFLGKNGNRVNLEFGVQDFSFKPNESRILKQEFDLVHYMFIYGTAERAVTLKGNYEEDKKKGVYHIFFGNERGIVKKIKFKREAIPHLRASNLINSANEAATPKFLSEKYNADIDMFGNSIFEPGSLIHITPSLPGSNGGKMVQRDSLSLGIGGYYRVIDTRNEIESGIFKTELITRWEARGDNTDDNGDGEGRSVKRDGKVVKSVERS